MAFKAHDAQLTFRMAPTMRKMFAERCDVEGLSESNVARLLVGGWLAGSIDIIASGTGRSTSPDPRQRTLPGITPASTKKKTRKGKK